MFAQFASGSIGATVTDATGAVVPAAKVVLKNESTNALRDTVTNSSGVFDFPSILPATYTVTITAAGLQTYEETGITLTQGSTLRLPTIVLQVQSTKQEVEVVAGADVVVPTDTGQASQTLNKNMIENISIAGRDAAELIKIMPGMAMIGGGNSGALNQSEWGQGSVATMSNTGPIGNFAAQGAPLYGGVTMTSDGANLLDPGNQGTQTANINQNQVQEVSILTSAYGAEFAKGPITFQAIGKSGGAQFHGQAYLYARNGIFDSNGSYNNSQGVQAPTNSFYYPGGDFGGPVIIPGTHFNKNHDKLFFYAAFEYMDQHPAGSLLSYFVPTQQMQQGNFTPAYLKSLGPGFVSNMYADSVAPSTTLFPTGQIPATLLDPNSAAILKLMPAPNVDPVTNPGGYNYQYFNNAPVNRYEVRLRGDYNINDKTKLFFSWNHQLEHDLNPISIWWNLNGSLPYPSSQNANQDSNVYSANLVHVFSPTLTNEFVFAEATFLNPIILAKPSAVSPSGIGFSMTGLFSNPYTPQMPNTYGYTAQSAGAVGFGTYSYGEPFTPAGANSFGKLSQTPQISDNVTKIQGSHTLKAGVYWDYARNYQTSGNLASGTGGAANFDEWGNQSSGNYLANFVTGRMTGFAQDNAEAVQDMKYHQVSFFINDQWKATRRLTLTGGLRFEHMGNWVPNDSEGVAVWDPATYNNTSSAPGWTGLEWHGIDSAIPLSGFPTKTLFVEPRFGFAYDIFGNGKTVLRGGAGLFRYQISYNSASSGYNQPLGLETESVLTGAGQCCVGWNQFAQYAAGLGAPGLGTSVGPLTMGDSATPNTWTYNVTVSQRVPWRSVAEFQYAGSRSRDLLTNGSEGLGNVDNIPLGAFFGADPITGVNYSAQGKVPVGYGSLTGFPNLNDFYPYHNYTGITLQGHESYSNYNAFIATWQKQSGRMTFTTNYTFSKNLGVRDDNSANGNSEGNAGWPYSAAANYGVLAADRTHVFNAAYVFNLPSPVKDNKLVGGVVNGWVLSGITQFQSGAPIQPNTNSLNVAWPTQLQPSDYLGTNAVEITEPALTCDPRSGLKSGQYFNPSCFAPPTGGSDGAIIWPFIHGPAFFNSDLAIYKDFLFKEHQKVEFRFSAFNFLNHPLPQFNSGGVGDVNLNFSNSSSGLSQTNTSALTTGSPLYKNEVPRVIEFAVKYNF
ncbi:MAG TPA: carboxypeptidase-like regulatory domain-containing protein [Bryobacteraceae bacterium]|nr:carboxypeptidase-like regulatory domain-containing protein [Bryobacteraceae bacterium]